MPIPKHTRKLSSTNTVASYQLSYPKRHIYFNLNRKKKNVDSLLQKDSYLQEIVEGPSQGSKEYKNIKTVGSSRSISSAYQEQIFSLSCINCMQSIKHLLTRKIYNGAGLILRQYSTIQLGPIKIPVLVRTKYLKR